MRRARRAPFLVALTVLAASAVLPAAAASAATAAPGAGPTETVPPDDGVVTVPAPAEPADPAAGEGDATPEEPPEGVTVPPTVPPPPVTGPIVGLPPPIAPPVAPPVDLARVRALVAKQLRAARAEQARLEAALTAAETRGAAAEGKRALADSQLAEATVESGKAVRRLRVARLDMRERATAAFIRGSLSDLTSVLEARDPNEFLRRTAFMGDALQADHDAIDAYQDAKGRVDSRVTRLTQTVSDGHRRP